MPGTIIATSDQHADSAPAGVQTRQIEFFKSLISRPDVDHVVSVGDLWSMTLDSTVDRVIKDPHCCALRDVLRDLSKVKKVVLVDGNHDPYSDMAANVPQDYARFVNWLDAPAISLRHRQWTYGADTTKPDIIFDHGCSMDPTTAMWKGITQSLGEVMGTESFVKFAQWVVGIVLHRPPTPREVRSQDTDAYNFLVSWIHDKWWQWTLANSGPARLVVTGHTHFDEYRHKELKRKTYVNCGAFDGNGNSYVEIRPDSVALRQWV
jgi:predicted phosphodiesterase